MPSKIRLFLAAPPHLVSAAKRTGFPLLPAPCPLVGRGNDYVFPSKDTSSNGWVLVSSAVSGGTLAWRLERAIERYGRDRVLPALERTAMDFPLPAPGGCGTPLSQLQLQQKIREHSPTVHFSSALCARYFLYRDTHALPHFVLFDDIFSFRQKLHLLRSLGLTIWVAMSSLV